MADNTDSKRTPRILNVSENEIKSNKTPLMFNMNENNDMPRAVRVPKTKASKKAASVAMSRTRRKTAVLPPSNPAEILGDGGYGIVFRPAISRMLRNKNDKTLPPNNITKLYFNNDSSNAAINLAHRVQELTGTAENFRVNSYNSPVTLRNLPPIVAERIKNINPDMYRGKMFYKATRQPYLGVSLDNLTYKATSPQKVRQLITNIRAIPLHVLLQQIYKLYSQVFSLNQNGYVHADLHPGNIMINPEKQTMTMIDFDLLNTFEDLYEKFNKEFGRSIWPNELAMEPFIGDRYRPIYNVDKNRYANENFYFFGNYWKALRVLNPTKLQSLIDVATEKNNPIIYDLIRSYDNDGVEAAIDGIIPHMDTYSLSFTMLSFLTSILGNQFILSKTADEVIPIITSLYPSEPNIPLMSNILLKYRNIFMGLSTFHLDVRLMPDVAMRKLKTALDSYVPHGGKRKTRRAKKRTSN